MTTTPEPSIILMAGSRWENTRGTDHRLAESLAKSIKVVWVDPPVPVVGPAAAGRPPIFPGFRVDTVRPNLVRLRILAPPGFSRPLAKSLVNALVGRAIRRAVPYLAVSPIGIVLMSPRDTFPEGISGRRLLHVTDDWLAGAGLMGLSLGSLEANMRRNLGRADVVTVVSPHLVSTVGQLGTGANAVVLPNGCQLPREPHAQDGDARRPIAGIIGQLNERLDMDLLDALSRSGVPIEVIGPRRERDAEATRRLDRFLESPNVRWLGEMPEQDLLPRLETMAVGLTPYADNEFNRASFPIKTLDYLAAGLPVVATDLPAVRWLASPFIMVGGSRDEFISHVRATVSAPASAAAVAERRAFAGSHTWDARARDMLDLILQGARS